MRVSQYGSRAIGLGLVFALAGFTYAVTSGVLQSESVSVSPRAIGTYLPLRFTTPNVMVGTAVPFPDEYDLGDASLGSVITRFVTAEGGVKPYRFESVGTQSLANLIANTDSSLLLGVSGLLSGKTPGTIPLSYKTVLGTPGLRFEVDVQDATGGANTAKKTGLFNLFLFDTTGPLFRFAVDTLPGARLDTAYTARIDVLGGHTPVTISALSVTDMGTGMPVDLATLGLYLAPNGAIFGRPLAVGTYAITAHAVDNSGAIARSRKNPNAVDQTLMLVVSDTPVTSSDTLTLSCSVSGDTGRSGGDSLRLSGLINVLGMDPFSLLNTDFAFQVAGIGFSGRLDKNGKLIVRNADGSTFTARISTKAGTISIQGSQGSFISLFGLTGVTNGMTVRRPIKIAVGEAVVSSEVLDFVASVNGTAYSFNYSQGHNGSNASGGFQIVSVKGRDSFSIDGFPGDAWQVGFVAMARNGVTNPNGLREGLDNITSVNVRVGTNFQESFTGAGIIGAGPKIHFVGGAVDGVQSFNLDTNSAKGVLVTRTLSTQDTGIPQAQAAITTNTLNQFFTLGLDVLRASKDAPYIGEHALRIFNVGSKYTDQPPARQTPPIF